MPLPIVYRKAGEGSIASYDFYDLFTRTGYKTFHGIKLFEVSTAVYSLIPDTQASDGRYTGGLYNYYTVGSDAGFDLDFDLSVTQTQTLKGNAIIVMPYAHYKGTGDVAATWTIKLYKVDAAAAETQLGSTVTKTLTLESPGSTPGIWATITGRIAIPIAVIIKKGEKIRLSVAVGSVSAGGGVILYHEPKGYLVSASILSTDLSVALPFQIDL